MNDENKENYVSEDTPNTNLPAENDSWAKLMDDFNIDTPNDDKQDDSNKSQTDSESRENESNNDTQETASNSDNGQDVLNDQSSDAQLPGKVIRNEIVDRGLFLKQPTITYPAAIGAAKDFLPANRVEEINTALREIEWRNEYETIDAIRSRGELSKEASDLAVRLKERGFEAGAMTPEEADSFYKYVSDSSVDVRKDKILKIRDMITKIRTGVRMERSWTPRQERFLDYLVSKVEMFEHGDLKPKYPFDIRAMWLDRQAAGDIENYRHDRTEMGRISYDDIPFDEDELAEKMEIPVKDLDLDELLEYANVDEKYVFAYGPYTYSDLQNIDELRSVYAKYDNMDVLGDMQTRRSVAYVQPMDDRLLDIYSPIRRKTPDSNGKAVRVGTKHMVGAINEFRSGSPIGYNYAERGSLEESLNNAYIAGEILEKLRLSPRDLVAVASSLGRKIDEIEIDESNEELKEAYKKLKEYCSRMSYYICSGIDMQPGEAKEVYGRARPTSSEFYEEACNRSEGWTEQQQKYSNSQRASVWIKVNDWLLKTEAAYADFIAILNSRGDMTTPDSETNQNSIDKNGYYGDAGDIASEALIAPSGENMNPTEELHQSFGKKVYNSPNLNNNGT